MRFDINHHHGFGRRLFLASSGQYRKEFNNSNRHSMEYINDFSLKGLGSNYSNKIKAFEFYGIH